MSNMHKKFKPLHQKKLHIRKRSITQDALVLH